MTEQEFRIRTADLVRRKQLTLESGAEAGYVVDYRAVDDRGTCDPCLQAEQNGPYLANEGPMPAAVCLGRGRCRCRRELVYDPAAYARLRGA